MKTVQIFGDWVYKRAKLEEIMQGLKLASMKKDIIM